MRQFLDVVHQTVELPLRIHLRSTSEREAVELFIVSQVAEHGFHRGKTSAVSDASFRAVDTQFHFAGETYRAICFALKEDDLPYLGFFRSA